MKKFLSEYKLPIIIGFLVVVILIGALLILNRPDKTTQLQNKMPDKYGYSLDQSSTKLQIDLYQQLLDELTKGQVDDFKYAELVAKSFIADYCTWTNKKGRQDIGGLEFIQKGFGENFRMYSMDNFYQNLPYLIKKYGAENLLEVVDFTKVVVDYANYTDIDGNIYEDVPAYYVALEWTYKENDKFDTSSYKTKSELLLIKTEEGIIQIANVY